MLFILIILGGILFFSLWIGIFAFVIVKLAKQFSAVSGADSVLVSYAKMNNLPVIPKLDISTLQGTVQSLSLIKKAINAITLPATNGSARLFHLHFFVQTNTAGDSSAKTNTMIDLLTYEYVGTRDFGNIFIANTYFTRYDMIPSPFGSGDVVALEGTEFEKYFKVYSLQHDASVQTTLPPDVMAMLIDSYPGISVQLRGGSITIYNPTMPKTEQEVAAYILLCQKLIAAIYES